MQAQHGILSTLRGALPALSATVAAHQDRSRTALGALVCEEFGFFDVRGRKRRAGCMKALRVLEAEGHISLPEAQCDLRIAKPRLLEEPVPGATDVPEDVRQVKDLEIVPVRNAEDRAVWNTLMDREHPRKVTTFAGAQVRYLIKSAHGYLGAAGFSAAALYLKPRDAWMAWSHEKRGSQLHRVVNLSRFLIRPGIQCKNLASRALGRILRRLAADFRERYGYAPYVVETFVGPEREGTCFKAVGFQYLGLTQGRGRHAPNNPRRDAPGGPRHLSRKKVFAYALQPDWRKRLGVPYVELRPRLEVGAGLCSETWAEQEFGAAELGDVRRTARLVGECRAGGKDHGQTTDGNSGARPGGGTGILALHGEGRQAGDHAGEDPGAAPRADDRADAYAGYGPLRTGRHGDQLQHTSGMQGTGRNR